PVQLFAIAFVGITIKPSSTWVFGIESPPMEEGSDVLGSEFVWSGDLYAKWPEIRPNFCIRSFFFIPR
ncbi:hypothetical protein, partial [Salmonella enterica]